MTTQILTNIVLFVLNARLYTATKKLRPEDLAVNGIDVSKLPPNTLAHLGSKKIISPKALAPFYALKREAERMILSKGVRFLGGYAVPVAEVQVLADKLNEIKLRFDNEKTDLLNKYPAEVAAWIQQNPQEWAPIIRAAVDPVSHVDRALQFSFAPISIESPQGMEESNPGLEEEAKGMFGQLCHEIRVAARQAYEDSFVGRATVTRKALRPIQAIKEKLAGMVFLDPALIGETITDIDTTLAKLPKSGPIQGTDLNMVAGLLGRQLSNMGRPVPVDNHEPEIEEIEEEPMVVIPPPAQEAEYAPIAWDF